jgi:sugar lactone lactonase YvrE
MHAARRQGQEQAPLALARPLTLRVRSAAAACALLACLLAPPSALAAPDCPGTAPPREVMSGLGVLEAIAADRAGRLYLSDMGGGRVLRVDRPGAEPHVLARFPSPGGLTWDADGTLIAGYGNGAAQGVADNGQAGLNRVDPDSGETATIASGMGMANGVVRGPDGAVYVTNTFGREGGRIDRVRGAQVDEAWSPVDGLNGLVIDRAGQNLYGSSTSGPPRIARIPIARPAEVETYAAPTEADGLNGFDGMARDDADRLYVTTQPAEEVWRIDGPGRICALARGIEAPSAVAFGGGGAGFPADSLYVITFTGRVIEVPAATDRPPAPGPPLRLRLAVEPRTVRAGRAARFRFRVRAADRGRTLPVAGAIVRFAGRRVATDGAGRAELVRRIVRPRALPATATARGYQAARAQVRVRAPALRRR